MLVSGKTQEQLAKQYFWNYFLTRSKLKAICHTVFLDAQREIGILFDALYCVKWDDVLWLINKVYNKIILLLIISTA